MDVTPVVDRLKTQLVGFNQVGGTADLDWVIENTPNVPAAFVIPLAESGGKPLLLGVHTQRLSKAFGVILVVSNLRDAAGAAAQADLTSRRLAVRSALAGWVPDATNGFPCAFTAGRLLRFDQGRLWWTDEFIVDDFFRSA